MNPKRIAGETKEDNYRKNLILIDFESFINLTKTSDAVIHYSE
jgi:hypothetical protein